MRTLSGCIVATICTLGFAGAESAAAQPGEGARWLGDYTRAFRQAETQRKMLLVWFCDAAPNARDDSFERDVLDHPYLAKRLSRYVCVKLATDAEVPTDADPVRLLEHASFSGLGGGPGLAVLDLSDPDAENYANVVSALPLAREQVLSTSRVAALLDLAPGSYEERAAAFEQAARQTPRVGINRFIDRVRTVVRMRRRAAGPCDGWLTDYGLACEAARRQGKMLLIYFQEPTENSRRMRFEKESLGNPEVRQRLGRYVCARLPLDVEVRVEGRCGRLLDEAGFEEMLDLPGLAIIDFASEGAAYYQTVVSTFPMIAGHWLGAENVRAVLDLPPGTLTQRTLIYAVRVHPEGPQSTRGRFDSYLAAEAQQHSEHQASIRLQGHHAWNVRFQRISAQLPAGLLAAEVCAESWPGQRLLESAIECVRCWRLSSGHWRAVSRYHPLYGYDMKRGGNGVWYATGVFGEGRLPE